MDRKILKSEIIIIIIAIFLMLIPNIVGTTTQSLTREYKSKKTLDVLKEGNPTIGCLIGTNISDVLKSKYPNLEICLYNTNEDVYQAVESGIIDYGISYSETIKEIVKSYEYITYIEEPVYIARECFVLPKTDRGNKVFKEFSIYIDEIKSNGTYDKIIKKWRDKDYTYKNYKFSAPNGVLKVITSGTWVPNTFIHDGKIVGAFIEIIYDFCEKYGYEPDVSVANYQAELAGIAVGEYDVMADIAEWTEERARTVLLTSPILESKSVIILREENKNVITVAKKDVFFKNLKDSFIRNFIENNRWKLILYGLMITILLSLASAFLGTIIGAVICAFRMSENSYMIAFARIYIKIIQNTPVVVTLMVFYYLIFNNMGFSAEVVAIIAFSINFSAYVSEIFRSGIEAVPKGQIQAAKSLGFSEGQIYKCIVMPQALIYILPVYSGQFISMVQLTSVAGYISVIDLTKASDFIRSRTYEAFFPLISTAIIYFILSALLVRILKFFENKVNLSIHRERFIEEVKNI